MGKKRILIIDDDVDFIDLHKAVLENNGFEVVTAFSGREGLDKVKFELPDLVLLDLMMEKHDTGFGFSKQMKADPRYKHIPIIMIQQSPKKRDTASPRNPMVIG